MLYCRRWLVGGTLFAALLIVAGSFAHAEALRTSAAPTRITIQATPIAAFDYRDPSKTRFSALEFRGGLALTSHYEPFGGVSAIHVEPDGSHFLAITDNGSWLRGRIVYQDGKPYRYRRRRDGADSRPRRRIADRNRRHVLYRH